MFQLHPGNFFFNLCGGNAFGSREVDDFALIFKEIEFAFPIVSHYEHVDVVIRYVTYFLIPAVFRNDFVDITDRFQNQLSVFIAVVGLFLFLQVELVC